MQVAELDHVVVDDRELADAGTRKRGDNRAADPPGANDRDVRCLELALPDPADLRQDDVPRVTLEFLIRQINHQPSFPRKRKSRSRSRRSGSKERAPAFAGETR